MGSLIFLFETTEFVIVALPATVGLMQVCWVWACISMSRTSTGVLTYVYLY